MKSPRLLSMTCAVALAAGAITAGAAVSAPDESHAATVPVRIAPNPATASEPFEGWGTSLVWFANATGNYPADVRQKLYDAVFGEDGLNLNIARYNIGGGNATDVPSYLRPGGAVPGFWNPNLPATDDKGAITSTYADRDRYKAAWNPDDPTHYDFTADSAQRWWIDALKGKVTHWEAFSNSPPYFLTQSGFVSGGINNATSEQLATADMDKFAGYLTTVVDELEKEHGIQFDTIDPFNEPNTNYWSTNIPSGQTWPTSASRQEGAHIGPQRQDEMIKALAARLADPDTKTDAVISAMDETNPGIFATNWNAWSLESKNAVDQLNVHTYGTGGRQVVRDIAKAADKPLWMSEVEGNWTPGKGFNPVDIGNGLGMAEHIVGDLQELEPDAWVFWQPVEDLYNMQKVEQLNWGSVFIDFDCNAQGNSERRLKDGDADPSCKVLTNEKYNTVRNFTHYIKPGDRLVASSNAQSTAAIDADGTGATVVHVNSETADRTVEIDLKDFGTVAANATVTPIVTTQSTAENPTVNALKQGAPVAVNPATKTATITVPARSVTTFVIDGASGVADTAAAFRNGQSVQLIGVQSGLALDGGSALAIRQPATTEAAAKPQTWTVTSLSGEGTNRHRFTLKNAAGQYLANANGGTALVTSDPSAAAADKNLQWMASTTDGSTYSVLSVGAERVLDVNQASTQPEARVGLWTSNGGGNQLWRLTGTAVLGVAPVTVSTPVGVAPTLPATVTASYAGQTSRAVPVTWQLDGKDWSKAGTVTVRGTGTDIFGATVEASAIVEIGAFTAARPASITVAAGSALASVKALAPKNVQAEVRADGAGFSTPVTWAWGDLTDAAFAQTGTVTVNGTATGPSGEQLPARLTVIVTDAVERNVAPQSRPSATYTESGYPVDRTINGQSADKGWSNWRSGTKNTQDTLTYGLAGPETVKRVTVQFYRDGGSLSWADTLRVDYRSAGGAWTQGALQTVPAPTTGAPKVEVSLGGVAADEVRVVMNARSQTHMVVSEVEIFASAPSVSGVADLARLTVGATAVAGFDPAKTDYAVTVTGDAWPTLNAQAVDQNAVVRITQPAAAGGVGTVRVTAPNGAERTYTVTVTRVPAATVAATASSRCISGKAVVTVTVQNDGATRADVRVESPYGAKNLGAIEPGKRASAAFTTRQASIPAGTATVTATVNGTPATVTAAIPAATCK
ncbi:RICIN domain-containing protein [Microbacterium sp. 22296]|uniref:RICIN domain-containing protein n=1 Tax=Microbacterium sp. 22296 TaxID=3453903 RepID=UPI003F83005A